MDSLFQSFNQQVSMHNFAELSGCVFSWIEEQCKPGDLQVDRIKLKLTFGSSCYTLVKTFADEFLTRFLTIKVNGRSHVFGSLLSCP